MPFHLRYAREFAVGRRLAAPDDRMSRLYVAEGIPTPTGAVADHRLRVRPSEIGDLAAMLLAEVMALGARVEGMPPELEVKLRASSAAPLDWTRAAARDLTAARGRGLVIPGDRQPARVHALAHLLNAALGNIGTTVRYSEPTLLGAGDPARGLAPLVEELRAGQGTGLVILEGNSSYTAPADAALSRYLRA